MIKANFIDFMQKNSRPINSDSIRPSIKPILTHKSDNLYHKRFTLNTNSSDKPNYKQIDSIQQRQTTIVFVSNFRQNNLYSFNKDLASSFSFSEDDEKYQEQKTLFSKFLISTSANFFTAIRDINKLKRDQWVSYVKIGDNEAAIQKNKIIAHYIGVWLQSMGYQQFETKKKIIMNLQFIFPQEQEISQIATRLYETLFHGYIPQQLQLRLLMQVCKKGWEYLSFFIAKFIKLLKKSKKISDQQFIKEVQKCIQGTN